MKKENQKVKLSEKIGMLMVCAGKNKFKKWNIENGFNY